ncbi:hypothetical protein [Paenibacillus thalictri]|uniref:Site-2 protease family protein n=1 Tax=Paenibacillus thalictri TaxID=2527873 RepID=A0A4Q9DSD8_9BACL|nr:hypothetical protein [Paenibacillus thalictri]TBL79797.1 hypothetical protein EYB31_09335 [Paenibacillus thalictri]
MILQMLEYFHTDTLLFRVIAFVIAAVFHDAVHAAALRMLGGRLTGVAGGGFQPSARMDPLGLAVLLFGPYGWTRKMDVELPGKGKKIVVYAVAPIANLLLGVLFWWLYFKLHLEADSVSPWIVLARGVLQYSIIVNFMYFLVHILPLYPLDGWYILKTAVSDKWRDLLSKYEKYGLILVLVLLISPPGQSFLEWLYQYCAQAVMNFFY